MLDWRSSRQAHVTCQRKDAKLTSWDKRAGMRAVARGTLARDARRSRRRLGRAGAVRESLLLRQRRWRAAVARSLHLLQLARSPSHLDCSAPTLITHLSPLLHTHTMVLDQEKLAKLQAASRIGACRCRRWRRRQAGHAAEMQGAAPAREREREADAACRAADTLAGRHVQRLAHRQRCRMPPSVLHCTFANAGHMLQAARARRGARSSSGPRAPAASTATRSSAPRSRSSTCSR